MQVTAIDERTSAVLDVTRWLAALAVVLTHLYDQMFLSLQQIPAENQTLA